MATLKRMRDLAIEAAIAIVLVGGLSVYILTRPPGFELDWKRIAFFLNTAVVFGFLITWFRNAWGRLVFWTVLLVLLVVHVAIYSFVLRRMDALPLMYYALLNTAELAVVVPPIRRLTQKPFD